MTFDGKAFGKDVVETTKAYIDKAVAPLLARIEALKAEIDVLKQQPVAKEVKPEDIAAIIADSVRKDVEALRSAVEAIPAPLPAPKLPDIPAMISEAVAAAMPEPVDVKALVIEAVATLPLAKDGAAGAKGDTGDTGPAGQPGLNGKDGTGLAGAMIDRKGVLVLTLTDGTTRDLGIVVGKDVDMDAVKDIIDTATHKQIAEAWAAIPEPKDGERGPQGEPGKSVTVDDITPLIETAVAKHVETIERMVPDVVKSAVSAIKVPETPQLPDIPAMVEAAVKALPPAQDGKDADPALVASLVTETVERAVAALPVPKDGQDGAAGADGRDGVNGADGKSVSIDDVRPLIEETVTKAVTLLPVPKDGIDGKDGRDGVDVKDLLVVEGGELVATFTDGRTKVLGQFRGKDGDPGKNGADGANGKDGVDGIGFDDVAEELEDDGRIVVRQFFRNGSVIKESRITTKMAIFRGVHDPARVYQPGDMVTRGGSVWHCDVECKGPFNGDFWTLSAKKGRDGKPD